MAGKFVISKDKKGEFRFVLKAGNGEIIAMSEGYASKSGAQNGIEYRTNPRPRIKTFRARRQCRSVSRSNHSTRCVHRKEIAPDIRPKLTKAPV